MNALAGLMNPAEIGQSLQQSFENGQTKRRQMDGQNALSAYAMNPEDPAAFKGLAQYHPEQAMQVRQQQAHAAQAGQDERKKLFARAAKAAQSPEQWDAIIDHLTPQFPEAAQFKGKFSPELRQAYMVAGGEADDTPKPQQPSIQREVEYYKSVGRDDLAEQLLQRHAEGSPIVANNGDGTFTIVPRNMVGHQGGQAGGPQPGTVEDGYRFKGGNPADPSAWEQVSDGGPTPQASGNFL